MNTSPPTENSSTRIDWGKLMLLVNEKAPESPYLDFKERRALLFKEVPQPEACSTCGNVKRKNPRDELVKDVTAFANGGGGRIIYGIKVQGKEPEERASELDCFQSIDKVTVDQITEIVKYKVPKLLGLDVYTVPSDNKPGGAYCIVIDVPQGETAYMAPDNRYYARVGSTTIKLDDTQVRDVMNRRRTPRVCAKVLFNPNTNTINNEGALIVDIYNTGNMMALHVMVEIKLPHILHGPVGVNNPKYLEDDDEGTYFLVKAIPDQSELPLFPDSSSRVVQVVRAAGAIRRRDGSDLRRRRNVGITIYADEMQPIRAEVPAEDIINNWVKIGGDTSRPIKDGGSTSSNF